MIRWEHHGCWWILAGTLHQTESPGELLSILCRKSSGRSTLFVYRRIEASWLHGNFWQKEFHEKSFSHENIALKGHYSRGPSKEGDLSLVVYLVGVPVTPQSTQPFGGLPPRRAYIIALHSIITCKVVLKLSKEEYGSWPPLYSPHLKNLTYDEHLARIQYLGLQVESQTQRGMLAILSVSPLAAKSLLPLWKKPYPPFISVWKIRAAGYIKSYLPWYLR